MEPQPSNPRARAAKSRSGTIPPGEPDERLDRYLVRTGLAASRRQARQMVERGMVRLNGRRCAKGALAHSGDIVEVEQGAPAAAIEADPIPDLEILFEDDAVIVVDKPGAVPCHPLRPGERGTVMNRVVAHAPETATAGIKAIEGGLVHRLDNGTSGALIVARTAEAFTTLRHAVRSGNVTRRYLALVAGDLNAPLELTAPIAHHPKSARRMVAVSNQERPRLRARPAMTRVEPLKRFGRFTLVRVIPQTGARHQIRVHLAAAGHPIAGDTLYGGPPLHGLAGGRFWLHLAELELDSPASGRVTASAPVPADLGGAMHRISRSDRSQ
jgi:23S rRNA pseudouridine1911/1915/1917 synthase